MKLLLEGIFGESDTFTISEREKFDYFTLECILKKF